MSFIVRCIAAPYEAFMLQKLPWNPLYSDRPYTPASSRNKSSSGIYNFYLLSLFGFGLIAWLGGLRWVFVWFLALSVCGAMLIDRTPLHQMVSLRDMPGQTWRYLHLLGQVLRTELLVLILATLLVFGLVKPLTRPLDVFDGYTFLVLYGLYLSIRIAVLCRYLFIVAFRWDTYHAPPFEIRKANFRDRSTAARHLIWSFLLGNVGLVVRCGYYDATVNLYDRFYSVVGYPQLSGAWGISLVVLTLALWVLLADMRLWNPYYKAHRALHEDQALYVSIHRIHHYAVYPTVLDSGTINPAEFVVTESGTIWFAPLPDWAWFTLQLYSLIGHFEGHHTRAEDNKSDKYYQFHVLHHRLYQCNYGLPAMDEKYHTLVTWQDMQAADDDQQQEEPAELELQESNPD